jgi:RimJ/RimL family protein N-acetyltransferase
MTLWWGRSLCGGCLRSGGPKLAWQFAPDQWGNGYATEAARAVAAWAFEESADELFAVMPANQRAKKLARRLGMEWVGETNKYCDMRLQVFSAQAFGPRHREQWI